MIIMAPLNTNQQQISFGVILIDLRRQFVP